MKKTNILQGWRDPKKNPEIKCDLLVIFKNNENGCVFPFCLFGGRIEDARDDDKNTLLAWQYLPAWEEEE